MLRKEINIINILPFELCDYSDFHSQSFFSWITMYLFSCTIFPQDNCTFHLFACYELSCLGSTKPKVQVTWNKCDAGLIYPPTLLSILLFISVIEFLNCHLSFRYDLIVMRSFICVLLALMSILLFVLSVTSCSTSHAF